VLYAAAAVLYDVLQIALALREERALLQFRDYLRPAASTTATATAKATATTFDSANGATNSSHAGAIGKQQQCVVVITVSVPRQQPRQHHDQRSQR
jgi:hypothetical protein